MKCSECNTPLGDGVKSCPVCGKETETFITEKEERKVINSPSFGRKKLKIVLIAAVSVLCAVIVVFFGYLAIKTFSDNEKTTVCKGCNTAFSGSGEYCEECKNNEIEKTKTEKNCPACRRKFVSENKFCDRCLENSNVALYDGHYSCEICLGTVAAKDIAWIDNSGYVYCTGCDTQHYCNGCNAVLSYDDDDDSCTLCAVFVCNGCEEVLSREEVVFQGRNEILCGDCYEPQKTCSICGESIWGGLSIITDKNGNVYCRDCAPTEIDIRCLGCGEFLEDDDDDLYCWKCAKISCCICQEVLKEDEIGMRNEYGDVFCKDCSDS